MVVSDAKKRSTADFTNLLEGLLQCNEVLFDEAGKSALPEAPGLYAIFDATGQCLHAGKSNTSLRKRVFEGHYSGGGKGAGSDLIQKVLGRKMADDRASAKSWIKKNCKIQWLLLEDNELRNWAEHSLLSQLQPIWGR